LTAAQRRAEILERLSKIYAGAQTALHYRNTYQLLVAVMLSAQSTDARVNAITPELFRRYPSVRDLAQARAADVEAAIKTVGLYRTKARNLIAAAKRIVEQHGGRIPKTMEELTALPGVGRKTANVVRSVAFQQDAIAVDTHVFRVANRLGLTHAKTPHEAEQQLMRVVPRKDWSHAHHWLIHHGRRVCHARNPDCPHCPLVDLCPAAKRFLKQRG
jgi:endonuclease-3